MDRYGVMGNPVKHSKSPYIHSMFAQQTGEDVHYDALLVPIDGFEQAVASFRDSGGKGLNITVPFKQEAWALVDSRSPRAEKAGAVNTIIFRQNEVAGDNTDGVGLVRDLAVNHGVDLPGKRVLILGAGGAVRGVLGPLLDAGIASAHIANRTPDKAIAIADLFIEMGEVHGCGYDNDALNSEFDLVINGTSASLKGEVPPVAAKVVAGAVCYDMMYGAEPTSFLRWCQENEAAACHDGLGMLVEQAAESFYQWREVRPETGPVLAKLHAEMGSPSSSSSSS